MSASRPCRFTSRERAPGTHFIGGWVDPRAGLDDIEKWTFFTLPGLELPLPLVVQPVAGRYTDWAIPAPNNNNTTLNNTSDFGLRFFAVYVPRRLIFPRRLLFIVTACFGPTDHLQVYRLLWWSYLLLTVMQFSISYVVVSDYFWLCGLTSCFLGVHEHVFALRFCWLVVYVGPECTSWGGSLLNGGRPSWKFNVMKSITKIFVLPWACSRKLNNSFIWREKTLEVMPRKQQYWENTQINNNISDSSQEKFLFYCGLALRSSKIHSSEERRLWR
jgi:hypothetical protein